MFSTTVFLKREKLEATLTGVLLKDMPECFDRVVGWYNDAWGHLRPEKPDYAINLYRERMSERPPVAFVVKLMEEPVGTFSLVPNTYGVAEPEAILLNNIYVSVDFRQQGIGTKIVSLAEQVAISLGIEFLQLGVVEESIGSFYERLGWIFSKEVLLEGRHRMWMYDRRLL